jgi:hypothetical protein
MNECMDEGHGYFSLSCKDFWTNSASYEYKNKSANKGAQLVSIGMPTNCWKTWSPKTTKILSTRKQSLPLMCASDYLYGLSEWRLTKYISFETSILAHFSYLNVWLQLQQSVHFCCDINHSNKLVVNIWHRVFCWHVLQVCIRKYFYAIYVEFI